MSLKCIHFFSVRTRVLLGDRKSVIQSSIRLGQWLVILTLLLNTLFTPFNQAVVKAAPLQPLAANLDCSASPFGRVLTIGGENEIMLGFEGGFRTTQESQAQFDLIDRDSTNHLTRTQTWASGTEADPALKKTAWLATMPIDIDGDGTMEMVDIFNDVNNNFRTAVHFNDGHVVLQSFPVLNNGEYLAAAKLSYGANQREFLIVAMRTQAGNLRVNQLDPIGGTMSRYWFTNQNNRANPTNIRLATADLKGDGSRNDIILAFQEQSGTAQLVVLGTNNDPATTINGTTQNGLNEVATLELGIGTPQSVQLATGDMDGDYHDEIVYAQENQNIDSPGVSSGIALRVYNVNYGTNGITGMLVERSRQDFSAATSDLALAMGDTARTGLANIVLGYHTFSPTNGLVVRVFDLFGDQTSTTDPNAGLPLRERNSFQNADNYRTQTSLLGLAVGDMDRNGFGDIVAAFRDNGQALQVVRMTDQITVGLGLQLLSDWRDASGGRNGAYGISVHLADADNDSLKAHYATVGTSTVQCKTVVEPNIVSAIFVPPYWHNIQTSELDRYGSIGQSKTFEHTNERGITSFQSHSISAYFGGGIDAEAFKASIKIKAGYEFEASTTSRGGDTVIKTNNEGWKNANSFAVIDNATYNCYTYQLRINNQDADGSTRFCQLVNKGQEAPSLNSWDSQNGPLNNPQAYQWAPITRDWADLALFKGETAVQSDNADNAKLAVDGNTDGDYAHGSVSLTANQPQPWWQVDLDASEPLHHVRVWNRTDRTCGTTICSARLTNFYVFVSDVDPRTISNDPNVLKSDPRVHAFYHPGVSGEVTNFLTLQNDFTPVQGRYVRVQLADAGILSLAEVQVFSENEVEPDRYPVAVSDPDATTKNGEYVPGKDGWFLVTLYNPVSGKYEDVRTRGNLLWNGANDNVLNNKIVGPGDGVPEWSLTTERSHFQTQSQELKQALSVGAEMEAEAGELVKVQTGASYEYKTGVISDTARTVSWGNGLEIGGAVKGFPTEINGKTQIWPNQCKYGFQPYYYEMTDSSNAGYTHRFMVVDYIVPQRNLDRTANLAACRKSTSEQAQPSLESNFTSGGPGSLFVLAARNFAANTPARIELKAPNAATFQPLATFSTNESGDLVFVLAIPTDAQPGVYTVRMTIDGVQAQQVTSPQSMVSAIDLTINASTPAHSDKPTDAPVVNLGQPTSKAIIYLPMIRR